MSRKRILIDADGMSNGNSWTKNDDNDNDEGFRALLTVQDDGCYVCEFEGPLKSTRRGYKCPVCRTIVIPSE